MYYCHDTSKGRSKDFELVIDISDKLFGFKTSGKEQTQGEKTLVQGHKEGH